MQSTCHSPSNSSPRAPSVACQVPGCTNTLTGTREYYRRYRICPTHCKMDCIFSTSGEPQRFCQLCGRFQPITAFEEGRRSCTERLNRHNECRKRRVAKALKAYPSEPCAASADAQGSQGSPQWGPITDDLDKMQQDYAHEGLGPLPHLVKVEPWPLTGHLLLGADTPASTAAFGAQAAAQRPQPGHSYNTTSACAWDEFKFGQAGPRPLSDTLNAAFRGSLRSMPNNLESQVHGNTTFAPQFFNSAPGRVQDGQSDPTFRNPNYLTAAEMLGAARQGAQGQQRQRPQSELLLSSEQQYMDNAYGPWAMGPGLGAVHAHARQRLVGSLSVHGALQSGPAASSSWSDALAAGAEAAAKREAMDLDSGDTSATNFCVLRSHPGPGGFSSEGLACGVPLPALAPGSAGLDSLAAGWLSLGLGQDTSCTLEHSFSQDSASGNMAGGPGATATAVRQVGQGAEGSRHGAPPAKRWETARLDQGVRVLGEHLSLQSLWDSIQSPDAACGRTKGLALMMVNGQLGFDPRPAARG